MLQSGLMCVRSDIWPVILALQRPIRPELVPQFPKSDQPFMVVEAAKPGTADDWTNWKWGLRDG